MDFLIFAAVVLVGLTFVRATYDRSRIALLASYLGRYQIEKLMATLSDGYMRALGETDPQRQQQVWDLLQVSETRLCEQFGQFAASIAKANEADTRVSTLAVALPWADRLFPRASFDLRKALAIHARGICAAVSDYPHESSKNRAYRLSAEMALMQHTCHWYCKSKAVASARLQVRHKTQYAHLLKAVGAQTTRDYQALLAG
ncbi:MAG: hypothetical protein ABI434_17060 [Burkholderiaceae bacterium]